MSNSQNVMYFKLEVLLNTLDITLRDHLTLTLRDPSNTSVTIRPLTTEEKDQYRDNFLICVAVTQREWPSDIHAVFVRLADNLMPEGFRLSKREREDIKYIDESGKITPGHNVALSLFPPDFQEFCSQVHHELNESIRRGVKIMRWRMGVGGPYNPIVSSSGVSWSFDGQSWHRSPADYEAEIELHVLPRVSSKVHSEIESLIANGQTEPLGHELFREAWGLRIRNPRSALIIGIVAAEVGFKQCIGKLVPDAEWLVIYAPTPPLNKMLSNYLPTLPAKLKIEGRVLKPSRRIRVAITNGLKARNDTVHAGFDPPKSRDLKELLLCIRDLLYLLDFYCGFEWAIDQIRDEVRQEMATEFDLKSTKPYSVIELG